MAYWLIHSPWQSIKQIDEFGGGSNDGCGPYALMMLQCGYLGQEPSYGMGEAIRLEMIRKGIFSGGTTLAHLKTESESMGWHTVYFHDWQDNTLPVDVISHALSFGKGVIFEVHNAAALPNNEQGVVNHFVAVAAYNGDVSPAHGYLLNSDISRIYRPPNGGPTQGYWSQDIVATLQGADARGYLVIDLAPPPPPPPPATVDINGAVVDLQQLQTMVNQAVADALKKLGQSGGNS